MRTLAKEKTGVQLRRFNTDEYHALAEAHILKPDEHVELLDGVIYEKYTDGRKRRFSVEEYYEMARAGILKPDEHVELIEGRIYTMSPIGSRHANCVDKLTRFFVRAVGDDALVRVQGPLRLPDGTEPEPDLMLLRPSDEYAERHPYPSDVHLLVEVSDTTLTFDQGRKLPLYAEHGVPEVWIVALSAARVEVHRAPEGQRYTQQAFAEPGMSVAPEAFPEAALAVADLL